MINFIINNLLWSKGIYIVATEITFMVIFFYIYKNLFYVFLFLLLFSIYFFRNPERKCVEAINNNNIIVCPSDGKVVDIQYDLEGFSKRVSIFLSIFDVHVNFSPMSGKIKQIKYTPGKFLMAYLPKSSELNERNDIVLEGEGNKVIKVRQIAGIIARRICCWVKEGDFLNLGDKYGMIRFGSRVDIFLPKNVKLNVKVGQKVRGGETVLAEWE